MANPAFTEHVGEIRDFKQLMVPAGETPWLERRAGQGAGRPIFQLRKKLTGFLMPRRPSLWLLGGKKLIGFFHPPHRQP